MKNIRNIGIIAHIDAGKTTLSERMLYYSRKIHRLGEVHDGTATMDYMPEEQERGITIMSACTTCQWNEHTINLIDTPGHVDFTIEVERSLRVLDGAVGVFCGVAGVEPQSETVWRQSESFGVPKIAFINKMDRMGADFANVLEGMKKRLGANPLPLTIPNGEGEAFDGVLDLLAREHLDFDQADQGRTVTRRPWSDAETAVAEPWRESLLEHLAEADAPFLDLYLGGEYSLDDVRAALEGVRDALQSGALTGYPVEDMEVTLTAVERREGQTTVPGCHMAAGMALREALAAASPVALEPLMKVEISVPDEFLGAAISLFGTAGGRVEDLEDRSGLKHVRGLAPLRKLFGFSTSLRSATQGRAGLVLTFDRFDLP